MQKNLSPRLEVTYPGGFGVTYTYQNGALKEIHRSDNNDLIWQLNDVTARGEITSVSYGNGLSTTKTYNNKGQLLSIQTGYNDSIQDLEYSYNTNGTMLWRKDHRHSSITEGFLYDNLKRLTASIVGTDTISIEYASNGNIESKSDLGDYAYSTIHPNAVINVSGSDSIDLNEEDISYTSFNKIDSLTQGDNQISFMYGSDYSRKKAISIINNTETTKFYSGIYEKSITLTDTTRTYYIMAYGSIVAMYKKTATEGNMYYVHTDHLGSVNCVTDNTGSIVQESSYDPWGNRRDPVTLEKLDTIPTNLITTRGYTGHEHMDEFGLINMNGRVYDPKLARFLNPDPVIANPTFTQDYNAYSYVRNNPLGYVDPSGYIVLSQAVKDMCDDLYNRSGEFGGQWQSGGGGGTYRDFTSMGDAFAAASEALDISNGWSYTEAGTRVGSEQRFNSAMGFYKSVITGFNIRFSLGSFVHKNRLSTKTSFHLDPKFSLFSCIDVVKEVWVGPVDPYASTVGGIVDFSAEDADYQIARAFKNVYQNIESEESFLAKDLFDFQTARSVAKRISSYGSAYGRTKTVSYHLTLDPTAQAKYIRYFTPGRRRKTSLTNPNVDESWFSPLPFRDQEQTRFSLMMITDNNQEIMKVYFYTYANLQNWVRFITTP